MADKWQKVSQRTVKCPQCKVRRFYVYENEDGASELRDALSGDKHKCTAKVVPQVGASTGPAIMRSTDDELAQLARYIPERHSLDSYVPRKVNGKTDLDTLIVAYKANEAHAKGTCLPECAKDCRKNPVYVMLVSDTGAGKNHLGRAMCAKLGVPYIRFPFSAGATLDSMFGKYTLPEAGRTVWQDGLLTLAARHGGVVFLDEINACPPEVAIALHSMLDAERLCVVADKPEAFRIAPTTFFIGTMNPDYAGTRPLNVAFKDRFQVQLHLDYEPAVEKKLIANPQLLKLADALRVQHRTGDGTINTPVGTRLLISYQSNRALFGEEIAREAFLNAFDTKEERSAVRESFLAFMEQGKSTEIDVDKDVNLDA